LEMIGNTAPFDVTHHPAMSIPCGMVDGLPVGMMLVGKHFDEPTIYRAAQAFQKSGDWKKRQSARSRTRMEGAITAVFEVLNFGAIMILVVLGLGVIAGMMGIFNFAHGEFVLLGAYTVYLFHESGLPVWSGIVAAPFVLAVFGALLERAVIRRFYAAPIIAMLGTYAISLVIR